MATTRDSEHNALVSVTVVDSLYPINVFDNLLGRPDPPRVAWCKIGQIPGRVHTLQIWKIGEKVTTLWPQPAALALSSTVAVNKEELQWDR